MNLLSKLPAYKGEVVPLRDNQSFADIKTEVCRAHDLYRADYDKIAKEFWRGNVRATVQYLFNFCKRYFTYVEESGDNQTTRSPAAIVSTANSWGVDCKHYAGFIAGVLDALGRLGYPVHWFYRFVSYKPFDDTPTHVFVVAVDAQGNETYVDPVFDSLDNREPGYWYKLDKNCSNMLSRVSGIDTSKIQPVDLTPVDATPVDGNKPKPVFADGFIEGIKSKEAKAWLLLIGGALAIYFLTKKRR